MDFTFHHSELPGVALLLVCKFKPYPGQAAAAAGLKGFSSLMLRPELTCSHVAEERILAAESLVAIAVEKGSVVCSALQVSTCLLNKLLFWSNF